MPGTADTRTSITRPRTAAAVESASVLVVIVNFCQWQNTAQLTKQLRHSDAVRGDDANIVIVDNHSPSDEASARLEGQRGVAIRRNRENRGFASAANHGAALGTSDWILLLNPDVSVADGFLDELLIAIEKAEACDPRTGAVGFQLRDTNGATQASVGRYPTFYSTLRGLLLPRNRRKCQLQSANHRQRVDWVTGGCVLIRRDCWQALQGFDEQFFLYYEDVDFCRRAAEAGWSIWYDPSLSVTHHWPLHKRSVPAPLRLITRHALLTYAAKHWRRWQAKLLRRIVLAESTIRGGCARLRGQRTPAACYRELCRMVREDSDRTDAEAIAFAAQFLRPIASAQDAVNSPP